MALCVRIAGVLGLLLLVAAGAAVGADPPDKAAAEAALDAALDFIDSQDGTVEHDPHGDVVRVVFDGEVFAGEPQDRGEITFKSRELAEAVQHLRRFPKLQSVAIQKMTLEDPGHLAHVLDIPHLEELTIEDEGTPLDPWLERLSRLHLSKLNLFDCNVGDVGLSHLGRMTTLRELNLVETKVTDAGLKHLQGLELTGLSLYHNGLTGNGLANLAALTQLRSLELGGNALQDADLAHLAPLKHLKTLGLGGNRLTDGCVPHLQALKELETLSLAGTAVTDETLKGLQSLTSLRELDVMVTKVTIVGVRRFHQARGGVKLFIYPLRVLGLDTEGSDQTDVMLDGEYRLREVGFGGDHPNEQALSVLGRFPELQRLRCSLASDKTMKYLAPLKDLKSLDLGNSKITDAGLRQLEGLSVLNNLSLHNTKITDAGLKQLDQHKTLESLDLSSTSVTDAGLRSLAALPRLKELSLRETLLTDEGLQQFAAWPALRRLDFCDTRVTMDGVRRFLRARPASMLAIGESYYDLRDSNKHAQRSDSALQFSFSPRIALGLAKILPDSTNVYLDDRLQVYLVSFNSDVIDEPAFAELAKYPEIEEIDLRLVNTIPRNGLRHLSGLTRLKIVQLPGEGRTTDDVLAQLVGLRHLEVLDLKDAKITDQGLQHLSGLTRLKSLSLAWTGISNVGLQFLGDLTALEQLDLNGTKVTGEGLTHLSRMKGLTELTLDNTATSSAGLQSLGGLTSLEQLDLMNTQVTGEGLKHLAGLKRLKKLDLDRAALANDALAQLEQLTQLEELHLERTGIGDAGLAHLGRMTHLRKLNISENHITDAGVVHLYGLTKLVRLNLHGTHVSRRGLALLHQEMPGLSMSWYED